VAQVSVEQANPPGVFDAAAIQAVNQWRFKPGILDREPVATWITVPLKFQIK
jgi:protein TonB